MQEVITTTESVVAVLVDGEDDDPLKVRGVALGENDRTYGNEKISIRWPKEVLEESAASLEGTKIVDPTEHWAPEGGEYGDDYPVDPPEETWVGEISDSGYEIGLGVVYEGEITDPDMADRVRDGDVEPSPTVFHDKVEISEDEFVSANINKWRDLAMVGRGASEGASIEPEESPSPAAGTGSNSVAAMSEGEIVSALSEAFDEGDDSVASLASLEHLQYDGTSGGKLEESSIPSDGYKSHYLFPGDTKSDSSFPVVDADGNLRRGNVESAWKLRSDAPVGEEEIADMLRTLAKKFDDPPVTEEDVSSLGAGEDEDDVSGDEDSDGTTGAATDPDDGTDTSADDDDDTAADSTMDLNEDEENLVQRFRFMEDPELVEGSVASLGEEAAEHDDPEILPGEEYDSLMGEVDRIKDFLGELLSEERGLREETVSSMSAGVMIGEFEDEDGELDSDEIASALSQEPKGGGDPEDGPGGDPDPDDDEIEAANQRARETLALPDVREMNERDQEPHEYVEQKHGVSAMEHGSVSSLQRAIEDGEN